MYLDDGIGGSSSALETVSISEKMQRDISAAGLTINREKSNLFPTREGSWLGFYYWYRKDDVFYSTRKVESTA